MVQVSDKHYTIKCAYIFSNLCRNRWSGFAMTTSRGTDCVSRTASTNVIPICYASSLDCRWFASGPAVIRPGGRITTTQACITSIHRPAWVRWTGVMTHLHSTSPIPLLRNTPTRQPWCQPLECSRKSVSTCWSCPEWLTISGGGEPVSPTGVCKRRANWTRLREDVGLCSCSMLWRIRVSSSVPLSLSASCFGSCSVTVDKDETTSDFVVVSYFASAYRLNIAQ